MINSNVYGFRKLPDKSIALIEEEAEVKRRMYQLCASGFGTRTIATILENGGIRKRTGKPFGANDILRMIKNPINKGCVVMGRLHYDFETKKTIKTDEEDWYIYEHKFQRQYPKSCGRKPMIILRKEDVIKRPEIKAI